MDDRHVSSRCGAATGSDMEPRAVSSAARGKVDERRHGGRPCGAQREVPCSSPGRRRGGKRRPGAL